MNSAGAAPVRALPARLLAYYGDDFTGSTDVMEVMAAAGLHTVLFVAPPGPADLARFPGARAIGVAGTARAQSPAWMDEELPQQFERLAALDAPIVQYKVCSTFDSSPQVGSIGRALEIGRRVLRPVAPVPIVVSAPRLGRYVAFANLFASASGGIFRIDHHPTMARHPVTPMREADLRRHLATQTAARVDSFTLPALQAPDAVTRLQLLLAQAPHAILFDTVDEATLAQVGRLLWECLPGPLFSVASSGLQYALVAHWRAAGLLAPATAPARADVAQAVVAVSGSCSPATAAQIDAAAAAGWDDIALDPLALLDEARATGYAARSADTARRALATGRSVVLHTARGPDDPRRRRVDAALAAGPDARQVTLARLGAALGRLLDAVLDGSRVTRAVVCGGDTAGAVVEALGIRALTMRAPLAPGSPLCDAHGGAHDGMQLALKGGQVGGPDYLLAAQRGQP